MYAVNLGRLPRNMFLSLSIITRCIRDRNASEIAHGLRILRLVCRLVPVTTTSLRHEMFSSTCEVKKMHIMPLVSFYTLNKSENF